MEFEEFVPDLKTFLEGETKLAKTLCIVVHGHVFCSAIPEMAFCSH